MALINITIHPAYNEDKLDLIIKKLNHAHSHLDYLIKQQIKMANEINAYLDRLETALTNIKQDITDIKEGLPATGGLTAEEVQNIKERLSSVVTSAEDLDAENERPEIPEEPEA